MKQYSVFILLIFFSCSKEKPQDLTLLFASKKCCQQPVTTKEYVVGDMFCSNSIYINTDSTYSIERGCEGESEITLGTWKSHNDSIIFIPLPKKEFDILGNVKWIYSKGSTTELTVIVKDKEYKPVKGFTVINSDEFDNLLENQAYNLFETNEKGIVTLNYSNYDSLEFPKLSNSNYNILAVGLPDTLEFILDINERAIMYDGYKYSENLKEQHPLFSTDTALILNETMYKRVKH